MDRRAVFFLAAAVLAAVVTPVVEDDLAWVPKLVAVTYVVLAAASYADWRGHRKRGG